MFNVAVLNIIWAMVAAKRYEYDDPEIKELMMMVTDVTASLAPKPSLGFLGRSNIFPYSIEKDSAARSMVPCRKVHYSCSRV